MVDVVYDLLPLAIRTFFIVVGPVVLVLMLVSLVTALLQAAMAIQEPVMLYAVRLGCLLLLGYLMLPTWMAAIRQLALLAFE
jgi:flagellar biosynthesis protein FliQ